MHYGHFYGNGHHQFAVGRGWSRHKRKDRRFKYGKMKGLKISPARSVARMDHTSFLRERSLRILLPTYPPSALSYHPRPPPGLLRASSSFSSPRARVSFCRSSAGLHRPRAAASAPSSIYPFEHLGRFATCHSSSNPSAARARAVVRACFPVGLPTADGEKRGVYEILVKTLLSGSKWTTCVCVWTRRSLATCERFRSRNKRTRRCVGAALPRTERLGRDEPAALKKTAVRSHRTPRDNDVSAVTWR